MARDRTRTGPVLVRPRRLRPLRPPRAAAPRPAGSVARRASARRPRAAPISDCVRSSANRSRRTSRSRSPSTAIRRSTVAASSASPKPGSSTPIVSAMPSPSSSSSRGRSSEIARYAPAASRASITCSVLTPDVRGDLRRRRRAAEVARHLLGDAVHAHRQLLQVARHAHRPAAVAEVALELAEDRRHCERRERGVAARLEPVDRLQQAQRRDLDEVVERLAAALVAPRELPRERQEALDERLAGRAGRRRGDSARAGGGPRARGPPGRSTQADMLRPYRHCLADDRSSARPSPFAVP